MPGTGPFNAAAIGAAEYTGLVTSTLQKIEKSLPDQVLRKQPTLDLLREESMSIVGRTMVYPLEGDEDESTVLTDRSGTFPTTKTENVVGAAEYPWSKPVVSKLRIDFMTLAKNAGGETQLFDLFKVHMNAVKKGHAKKLIQLIHKLGGDVETGQFEPFDVVFGNHEVNPTSGQITADDADHYWNAQRLGLHRDVTGFGEGKIFKVFREVENELTEKTSDMHELTHIIAGRNIFTEYVDALDDKTRYNLNSGSSDGNEPQTKFKEVWYGNIAVRFDPDCQTDRAYFIDKNTVRLRYLNGNFMKAHESRPVQGATEGTLDYITPLATVFAAGTNHRRNNAVLEREDTTPVG